MKKKVLSIVLAASLAAMSLAGCGSSSESAPAASNDAASTEAAAPAADGAVWVIGGIGPTTGAAAAYGTCVMNSAQIAVDEINAAGGINGYQIKFSAQDDEHDAQKSVNAYNSLKDQDVDLILGTVTTAPCIAVSAEANSDRVFMLTPSASSEDVNKNPGYDNVYQVCFTDPAQGLMSADYIKDNALGSKVGIIYNASDAYSTGIKDTFVEEAGKIGLEFAEPQAFTDDSSTDFTTQLQKIVSDGCDVLFLPTYYQVNAIILKQMKDMGAEMLVFGVDGMDGILGVEGFDTSLAEGVYLLTPFAADATDDLTVNFVTEYQKRHSEIPNQFGADAYDGIYIFKMALEQANLTPAASAAEICEAMISVMPTITYSGLTGDNMTWSAVGAVSKAPKAVIIKDGVYVSAK